MYISRREVRVVGGRNRDFHAFNQALHEGMSAASGFRWVMLLRSAGYPGKFADVQMWQTREQAQEWQESDAAMQVFGQHSLQGMVSPLGAQGYDVTTARGSMTPASFAAIVDWEVGLTEAPAFINRWNAMFHALEDKLGSRLLRHLGRPGLFAGLHVSMEEASLSAEMLAAEIAEAPTLALRPVDVDRFDVVLLTEG